MDMNEYSLARITADRLAEARHAAEHQRLLDAVRDPRGALSARAGRVLIGIGLWLSGPGPRAREAWH